MSSTILVIDDDPDLRELVTLRLSMAGFETHSAADGESGLAAVRELRPDVVILDWMMPRMTGVDICRAMRSDDDLADIPVLLLTAKAQVADLQRAFSAGADDYMIKPFSPAELVERVTAILGRSL